MKGHRKNQYQYQRQPEFRDATEHGSTLAQEPVRPFIFVPCAQNPQSQRAHEGQNKTDAAENQRIVDPLANDLGNTLLVLKGNTEIALQRILCPADILDMDRIVKAQLLSCRIFFLWTHFFHPLAVIGHQGITGGQPGNIEHR